MDKRKIRTRLAAFVMAVLMMSLMTMNVFAASKTATPKYSATKSTFTISTPYQYRWFWQSRKRMTVTVKNNGSSLMTIYMKPLNRGCEAKVFTVQTVSRGSEKQVYTLPYDNCSYEMTIYYSSRGFNRSATVTTSAGSVQGR